MLENELRLKHRPTGEIRVMPFEPTPIRDFVHMMEDFCAAQGWAMKDVSILMTPEQEENA